MALSETQKIANRARAKKQLEMIKSPLALGGEHSDSNIQLLCQTCNQKKHAKHPIEFMRSRGMLL